MSRSEKMLDNQDAQKGMRKLNHRIQFAVDEDQYKKLSEEAEFYKYTKVNVYARDKVTGTLKPFSSEIDGEIKQKKSRKTKSKDKPDKPATDGMMTFTNLKDK